MSRTEVALRGIAVSPVDSEAASLSDVPQVVLDANIFARRQWMGPIVESARAERTVLFWSPAIIAEASRVLQWIRLSQYGGPLSESVKRETFDLARRWFDVMTTVFHVVEDRPPYDRLWSETLSDEHDRQIWTAAVRSRAHMVVTDNLRDAPPPDQDGLQIWDGILFVHPDTCLAFLAWLTRPRVSIDDAEQSSDPSPTATTRPDDSRGLHPRILEFLRATDLTPTAESSPFEADE